MNLQQILGGGPQGIKTNMAEPPVKTNMLDSPAIASFLRGMTGERQPTNYQPPQAGYQGLMAQMAGERGRPSQGGIPGFSSPMPAPPQVNPVPPSIQDQMGVQNTYERMAARKTPDIRKRIAMMLMGMR